MGYKTVIDIDLVDKRWLTVFPEEDFHYKITTYIQSFMGKVIDQVNDLSHLFKNKQYISTSVSFTNNEEIKYLNNKYRNKNRVTNVLAFPQYNYFDLGDDDYNIISSVEYIELGDIIISLDRVIFEAEKQEKDLLNHVYHLLLHALLHLFGYDHKITSERLIMEKLEIDLLSEIHVPNPYLY